MQGDFQSASIGTFMAINGDGFFVVQKPSSFTDGRPTFDGSDLYTRRGDFQTDKDGFLVNGAGYYLMGVPVDAKTGNLAGSVPQLLKFQNDFLPAQPTTQIQYRANLAAYPATQAHDTSVPGSELIDPRTFSANPVAGSPTPAQITGFGGVLSGDARRTPDRDADRSDDGDHHRVADNQRSGRRDHEWHDPRADSRRDQYADRGERYGGFTAAGSTVGGAPAAITVTRGRPQRRRGSHRQHDPRNRHRRAGRDQDQHGG